MPLPWLGLVSGLVRLCLEFHSKFPPKNLARCHHYKYVGRHERFLVWVESRAATIPLSSIHHRNHTHHTSLVGPSQRRRLELKSIKLQYISRPYKAACTDTRPRKNSPNINQVIENLCGWFEASWFITPSQISLRYRGCSLQRRREYQFPRWFLAVFRIWSVHIIGCNLYHNIYSELQPKYWCVIAPRFLLETRRWTKCEIDVMLSSNWNCSWHLRSLFKKFSRPNLCIWWDCSHQNIDKNRKLKLYQFNKFVGWIPKTPNWWPSSRPSC